jgi:hypothetical protein
MTHDLQRSEFAFLDYPGSGSAARSAPATIAVFPRQASRGRLRAYVFDALARIGSPGVHAPRGPALLPA